MYYCKVMLIIFWTFTLYFIGKVSEHVANVIMMQFTCSADRKWDQNIELSLCEWPRDELDKNLCVDDLFFYLKTKVFYNILILHSVILYFITSDKSSSKRSLFCVIYRNLSQELLLNDKNHNIAEQKAQKKFRYNS